MENNRPKMKFCKHCGAKIPVQAVICKSCGGQVENLKRERVEQPNVVIHNTNMNTNVNRNYSGERRHGKEKNKWVAFALCLFIGYFGAHKFYEGKMGMGILYLITGGLVGIGWMVDIIGLLLKPNPYYV